MYVFQVSEVLYNSCMFVVVQVNNVLLRQALICTIKKEKLQVMMTPVLRNGFILKYRLHHKDY